LPSVLPSILAYEQEQQFDFFIAVVILPDFIQGAYESLNLVTFCLLALDQLGRT
jgi:hypothetical protein